MTVREDRDVDAPPALAIAALATAGENVGLEVRDARADPPVAVLSSGTTLRGASFGFVVTARARRGARYTRLSVDVTPVLGSWALESSQEILDELIQEFQLVMGAPKARVRRPDRISPGQRPFGWVPELFGGVWAGLSVLLFGVIVAGWGWLPAGLALGGALLILVPVGHPWWDWAVTAAAVGSLPFGALGLVARRLARVNHYWQGTVEA